MEQNRLQSIFEKTDGYCHICHKQLAFVNYGRLGTKGAWHIEHSIPKAKGGTGHLNNLFAACISCNLEKGVMHTRTVRAWNGNSRAPYGKKRKNQIRNENTIAGGTIGLVIGAAIAGPFGAGVGTFIGALIGDSASPRK